MEEPLSNSPRLSLVDSSQIQEVGMATLNEEKLRSLQRAYEILCRTLNVDEETRNTAWSHLMTVFSKEYLVKNFFLPFSPFLHHF